MRSLIDLRSENVAIWWLYDYYLECGNNVKEKCPYKVNTLVVICACA